MKSSPWTMNRVDVVIRRMCNMNDLKVYVDVIVSFRNNGVMFSRQITWEDGHKYVIEWFSDIRPAAAAKAGGQGELHGVN